MQATLLSDCSMTLCTGLVVNQNTQKVQMNAIFGKCCLRQSDERLNRYKTRNVVNTYLILDVTFEDRFFSNAPTFAKIEFGNDESEK